VSKRIPDSDLTSADGQAKIAEVIGSMVGFVSLGLSFLCFLTWVFHS